MRSFRDQPFRSRQQKRIQVQGDYSKERFVDYFVSKNISENISLVVWDLFTQEVCVDGFMPMPSDNIIELYGIADEELEDLLAEVMQACKRKLPNEKELEAMSPIVTINDLVVFASGIEESRDNKQIQ